MTPFELGWVAGFLEGEGSFGAHSKSFRVWVTAVQVQREPLERLRRYTHMGQLTAPRIRSQDRFSSQQPCSTWNLYGQNAVLLMKELRDHMSPRRQVQIDRALTRFAARLTRKEIAVKTWATRHQMGTARKSALKSWSTRRRLAAVNQLSLESG